MSTSLDVPLEARFAYRKGAVHSDTLAVVIAHLRTLEPKSAQIQRIIENLENSISDHPFNLLIPDPFLTTITDPRVTGLGLPSHAFFCPWIDPTGQWTNIKIGPQEPEDAEEITIAEAEYLPIDSEVYIGGRLCRKTMNYRFLPVQIYRNPTFEHSAMLARIAVEAFGLKLYKKIEYAQSLEQAKKVFGMMSRLVGCTPFVTEIQPPDVGVHNVVIRPSHGMITAVFIAKDHSVGILQENIFLRTVGLLPYVEHIKGLPRGHLGMVRTKDGRSFFIRKVDQDPKNLRKKRITVFRKTKAGIKKKSLRLQDLVQSKPKQIILQQATIGKILLPFVRFLPIAKPTLGL